MLTLSDADASNEKGKSSSAASTKPKSKNFKERLFGKRKKVILKSPRIDSISGALLHVCAV